MMNSVLCLECGVAWSEEEGIVCPICGQSLNSEILTKQTEVILAKISELEKRVLKLEINGTIFHGGQDEKN